MLRFEINPDTIPMSDRSDITAGPEEFRLAEHARNQLVTDLASTDVQLLSIRVEFACLKDGLRAHFYVQFSIPQDEVFEAQTEVGFPDKQSHKAGKGTDWPARAANSIVFAIRVRLTMELASSGKQWDDRARGVERVLLSVSAVGESEQA